MKEGGESFERFTSRCNTIAARAYLGRLLFAVQGPPRTRVSHSSSLPLSHEDPATGVTAQVVVQEEEEQKQ